MEDRTRGREGVGVKDECGHWIMFLPAWMAIDQPLSVVLFCQSGEIREEWSRQRHPEPKSEEINGVQGRGRETKRGAKEEREH